MESYRILTIGALDGVGKYAEDIYKEQMDWRNSIETCIRSKTDVPLTFVHPPIYLQSDNDNMRMWEINQIKKSDIIILNLCTITNNITNLIQLGMIDAINNLGFKHIDVVGFGANKFNHPWIEPILTKKELTVEDAAEYIVNYLLI